MSPRQKDAGHEGRENVVKEERAGDEKQMRRECSDDNNTLTNGGGAGGKTQSAVICRLTEPMKARAAGGESKMKTTRLRRSELIVPRAPPSIRGILVG